MAKRGRPKKKVEEKVEVPEVQEKEDVQKAGEAYYQRKFLKKEPEVVEKAEPKVKSKPKPKPPPEPKKEDNHPMEKLLRYDEVGQIFGITESCVNLWVQNSHLVSVNVGGMRMITNSSVLTCPFKRFG